MGAAIGPYRLLSEIGQGGFGIVYLAERREPHIQRVAIKVLKPGMDSRAVVSRFEHERQALAVMDHPNVARVFDGGVTPDGRPYFVMELVQGEPITTYCDRARLSIRDRLELFISVCDAVQHAHHKGVIHRDIKPSNVLVALVDGRPVPKVIDFGIAKSINPGWAAGTLFTEQGVFLGTPEYMSPEQADLGALDVDARTDVYSLGVLLYELLTGSLPFEPAALRQAGFDEIRRIIREVDPPRPSARVEETTRESDESAILRGMQPLALRNALRAELEWIPLRALRKERSQRYRSPAELAEDIAAYLAGRPLRAGPTSARYHLRKFARRHRIGLSAATVVAASLVTAMGLSLHFAARAAESRRDAEQRLAQIRKLIEPIAAMNELDALSVLGLVEDSEESRTRAENESIDALLGVAQQAFDPTDRNLIWLTIGFVELRGGFLWDNWRDPSDRAWGEPLLRNAIATLERSGQSRTPAMYKACDSLSALLHADGRVEEAQNLRARADQIESELQALPSERAPEG